MKLTGERPLRQGDIVEVRSEAEILATLNGDFVDSMPFMPEMLRHVGRRYKVSCRVDKICDTVTTTGSRRLHDTVFLEDLRCDGAAHGGCQQGCRILLERSVAPPRRSGIVQKSHRRSFR